MLTADQDDAGTDDLIHLRITTSDGRLVVDHSFKDTDQEDQEEGEANIYFVPVGTPFTKAELGERSIQLSIGGEDAWLPAGFFLFGLSEALPTYFSPQVEPLVHLATWPFGLMSKEAGEGRESVFLPLLPSPPVIL
jgi:hypothetical protein